MTLAEIDKRIGAQVQALTDTFFARLELAESGVKENATAMTEVRPRSCRSRPRACSSSTSTRPTRRRCRRASTSRPTRASSPSSCRRTRCATSRSCCASCANFDALKDKQAADTARMMEQMKKLLAEMLAKSDGLGKKGGSAGTTLACLLCGDQVPEVSVCDFGDGPPPAAAQARPVGRRAPTRSSTRSSARTCTERASACRRAGRARRRAWRSTRPRPAAAARPATSTAARRPRPAAARRSGSTTATPAPSTPPRCPRRASASASRRARATARTTCARAPRRRRRRAAAPRSPSRARAPRPTGYSTRPPR